MSEISPLAREIEQTPGITRLLDRLEAKRLVERERCREDRRRVLCTVSDRGLELLAKLDDPVSRVDEWLLRKLEPDEQEVLIEMLGRVRRGVEAAAPPEPADTPSGGPG